MIFTDVHTQSFIFNFNICYQGILRNRFRLVINLMLITFTKMPAKAE